ncbi:MAG: DUF4271 domain-containing protein [Bacteroidales bacterium]|nr:DUF4271 domain-containing protein [Bacteroidales bacterium]
MHKLTNTMPVDSSYYSAGGPINGETIHGFAETAGNPGFVLEMPENELYFFFLLLLIAGYAVARLSLGQLLRTTYSATIRYNVASKLFDDNSLLQRQIDQVLYVFYFLSAGFFLMQVEIRTGWIPYQLEGIKLYALNVGFLTISFLLRIAILSIIGHIFEKSDIFHAYIYHTYFYNKLAGILLLPLNFLLIFTVEILNDIVLYTSLALLVTIFIMKILRGIVFSFKHGILNFYLFLYLCALELVPILLVLKWFSGIVCTL